MRAIIFANGVLKNWPDNFTIARGHDIIIAADGGTFHCRTWKITPHVVVGDLDSIARAEYDWLKTVEVEIIRHPSRKDQTDLELALRVARERGAREIYILGALGLRWDMTIANVLLLAAPFLEDTSVKLVDGQQEIFCLRGGQKQTIPGQPGDLLSLLPLSGEVTGLTLDGLEYPLQDACLPLSATRGISNIFQNQCATVKLRAGLLLITITRKNSP